VDGWCGRRTTVFARQGHHAFDPSNIAAYPPAAWSVDHSGDLVNHEFTAFAWTADKDGIGPGLLAAEMTLRTGRDPGELYRAITHDLGEPAARRLQATATPQQKRCLARLSRREFRPTDLAGETIRRILDRAPGNEAPIGGLKVMTDSSGFAARPSGTEDIYKIYAESFRGEKHLDRVLEQAQEMVDAALAVPR
jgi:phosphoglucomutase